MGRCEVTPTYPVGSEARQPPSTPSPPPRRAFPVHGAKEVAFSSLPGCPCLREERAAVWVSSARTGEE